MLVVSLATATQRQTCSTNGTHKLPVQLSLATAPGFGAAAPATAAGNGESRPLGLCRDQPLPEPAPVPPAASVGLCLARFLLRVNLEAPRQVAE